MKRKRLMLIVFLTFVLFITVPIILRIINNIKKKAAIDSAYEYREAINRHYYSKVSIDPDYKIQDGEYEIFEYKNIGLVIDGDEPLDGWVKVEDNRVTDFSLIIGEYAVTYDSTSNTIAAVKGGELVLTPAVLEKYCAKIAALIIASEQTGTTQIIDISEGWVAFIDGKLKAYSVSITVNDKDYIVTDNDVEYDVDDEITYNNSFVVEGTKLFSKNEIEKLIINYYSEQALTDVSNYISSLLSDSMIQNFNNDKCKKVSEIHSPISLNGIDKDSWIYFKRELSSVTIPDYSIKVTRGGYSFVINNVGRIVSDPIYDGSILSQIVPASFVENSNLVSKINTTNNNSYESTKEIVNISTDVSSVVEEVHDSVVDTVENDSTDTGTNNSTDTGTPIKVDEPIIPIVQEDVLAKEAALAIVSESSGSTEIIDITDGWVAFMNGELKAYSVHVSINNKDYIVTDNGVEYDDEITYNNAVAIEGTEISSKTEIEQLIINYYSEQALNDASNYISSLLEDTTIQGYVKDTSMKVSEIDSPEVPTGVDADSWIYFKKGISTLTISDYSIKITKGGYSFVVNKVNGIVFDPIYDGFLLDQMYPLSFADDSWETIKSNLSVDRTAYNIGDTKEVVIDDISYTVRLANTSSCPNDWPLAASHSTCGVVIEFVDMIIDTDNNNKDGHVMNTTATNLGGWPASDMYTFLNTTIFNKLPDELKADGMILNTKTVSGYGNHEGETNYTSLNDKLYLLSYAEVWGANAAWDTVKLVSNNVTDGTRQLEYYMMDNSTRIKTTPSGTVKRWWLRSPNSYYAEKFYNVYIDGSASNNNADINNGVAPVFRILD